MERIAAVVVTYNRKELLRQCVEHLLAQQGAACDILITDNASTDGTREEIAGVLNEHVRYQNTGKNLGGAGGFHFGMKWAAEAGYDGIWIMDDDTLPEADALEKLLDADAALKGDYGFLSSRVLWTDGTDCPMNLQRKTPYKDIDGFDKPLVSVAMASFVSLFLRAATVKEFGLPIAEFFIWSDDWEYTRRISLQRRCYAVRDSRVVHAMKNNTVVNIATDTPERLPRYVYFYRNDVYLYRREGWKGWLWLLAKNCWHSLQVLLRCKKEKSKKLKIIWGGFCAGCRFLNNGEDVV